MPTKHRAASGSQQTSSAGDRRRKCRKRDRRLCSLLRRRNPPRSSRRAALFGSLHSPCLGLALRKNPALRTSQVKRYSRSRGHFREKRGRSSAEASNSLGKFSPAVQLRATLHNTRNQKPTKMHSRAMTRARDMASHVLRGRTSDAPRAAAHNSRTTHRPTAAACASRSCAMHASHARQAERQTELCTNWCSVCPDHVKCNSGPAARRRECIAVQRAPPARNA